MKNICVVGSLNVDMTISLPRFHMPGETMVADSIHVYAGGKGGNQAVAAARLGCPVMMAGMLGDDANGQFYRQVLRDNGVNFALVGQVADTPSGTAIIEVDKRGENRIAIVPGTNALVDQKYVDGLMPVLARYDICLLQLEIPVGTVTYVAEKMRGMGKTVILDPAPAQPLPDALCRAIDYLTPNRTELSMLSGMKADTLMEVERAARALTARGAGVVIAKLGEAGCMLVSPTEARLVPGYKVNVVDTTAAGDSFNAGLAAALAEDLPIDKALAFANAVGALSTTGAGAQAAMPARREALSLMNRA